MVETARNLEPEVGVKEGIRGLGPKHVEDLER